MSDPSPSPAPEPPAAPSAGRRALLAAGPGAAVLALVAAGVWSWRRLEPPAGPDPGALRLFTQSLPDAEGVPRPLRTWQGKLLIVNFWATWCAPCVEEMPQLQQFVDALGSTDVALIGIGVDDADKVREFRTLHRLRFPLLVAGFDGMEMAQALGNRQAVLPYTALISPDGRLLEAQTGRVEGAQLHRWVAEHAAR